MRTFMTLVFGFLIAWSGSYLSFRSIHSEPPGLVLKTIVPMPADNPLLVRVYAPLADVDARMTGSTIR